MKALLLFLATTILAQAAPIKIVAAENFYGSVAKEIAGDDADVTSILSNPNQDPHEFTSSASTARAVADADIVIYNGLGYDAWMEKLLGTNGKPGRVIICVGDLIGAKDGANPHIWYDPRTMPAMVTKLVTELTRRDLKHSDQFQDHMQTFNLKMKMAVRAMIDGVKQMNASVKVTATEPVFGYMADALGLTMLNYDFQISVMNDTEPSAAQTAAFEKSLRSHTVKLLFYNSQVTDPTTERLKKLAEKLSIPIVGVAEMQPADKPDYPFWLEDEILKVQFSLAIKHSL